MKKSFFPGTTGVFCLFFIPYMITIIFNGVDTTLINRKFDVETILIPLKILIVKLRKK